MTRPPEYWGLLRTSAHGLIVLLGCAALLGCREANGPLSAEEKAAHLNYIGAAYEKATEQLGHPPNDLEQLRPFLQAHGNPDTLLRSPQDGMPYVILWGRPFSCSALPTATPTVLAYEQQGVAGNHQVLTSVGVTTMTDQELSRVLPRR